MAESDNKLYPLFVDLAGRRVLVVGGGKIACRKVGSLLQTGAEIDVIALDPDIRMVKLADSGLLNLTISSFSEEHFMQDYWLVIAATDCRETNELIFNMAEEKRVFCNVVDVPDLCSFQVPAVVKRGSLQIAISTSGKSPVLARRLKSKFNAEFGPEYKARLELLGIIRQRIKILFPDSYRQRAELNNRAIDSADLDNLDVNNLTEIDEFIKLL